MLENTALIPVAEVDLVPIALANGNVANLDFGTAANFEQAITDYAPLILLVKADGEFYEGQGTPSASYNALREANVWHSIPVNRRAAWKFLRSGSSTVTIKGKLLLGV